MIRRLSDRQRVASYGSPHCNEGANVPSRFLQDAEAWLALTLPLRSLRIDVQHDRTTQADGRDNRIIGGTVLMWHDTLPRFVLVDQDMVRSLVRAFVKYVTAGLAARALTFAQ